MKLGAAGWLIVGSIAFSLVSALSSGSRAAKFWALVAVIYALLALGVMCHAQSLDLTNDTGRVFNYPRGEWVLATAPGVEWSQGPFCASWAAYYDGSWFEHDLSLSVEHEFTPRFSLGASLSRYAYRGYDRDFVWSVSSRWHVWGRP